MKSATLDSLLPKGKLAHLVLTKVGGHIHLDVNGKEFMDYTDVETADNKVYSGGRFGFRQIYEAEGNYANFKMYDLTKKVETK